MPFIRQPRVGWIEDGIGYIPLTKGFVAKVSPYRVAELSQYSWSACCYNGRVIAVRRQRPRKQLIRMHRQILDLLENQTLVVDHINHDSLDNRDENLRACTQQQNVFNYSIRSDNTSGHPGVSWSKKNRKWVVTMKVGVKSRYFGSYLSFEEACAHQVQIARKYFGEYAHA